MSLTRDIVDEALGRVRQHYRPPFVAHTRACCPTVAQQLPKVYHIWSRTDYRQIPRLGMAVVSLDHYKEPVVNQARCAAGVD